MYKKFRKMTIKVAPSINKIHEYFFSKKLKEIQNLSSKGFKIINLGIGSPDILPPKSVIEKLKNSVTLPNANRYQSYIGTEELRSAFSKWYYNNYNVNLNPKNEILPLMGSKEGIMYISLAYLTHGDKILAPDPGYPVYDSAAKITNAETIFYKLKEISSWNLDIDYLNKINIKNVKILWINSPHMPTGSVINLSNLEKIVFFAKKNNILIVYDNPYSLLYKNPISIFQIKEARDISLELNSLSKSYNMSGWRIGVVVGKKELINNIIKIKSQIDSGMYLPIQIAAIEALKYSKEWIININNKYNERRKIIYSICDILNLSYKKNTLGIFVWAKLNDIKDDINWSNYMLYNKHIFITPGSTFGKCGKGYVRFSLCCSTKDLEEVKKRINK